jgi:hypothetical protein
MTETVTFDFGGVAFSRTALAAPDFSLPARTTRFCPANCGLTDFAFAGLTACGDRTKFACGGLTERTIGALTGAGDACGGLTGISFGALTAFACGGLTDRDLMRGEFFMTNLAFSRPSLVLRVWDRLTPNDSVYFCSRIQQFSPNEVFL